MASKTWLGSMRIVAAAIIGGAAALSAACTADAVPAPVDKANQDDTASSNPTQPKSAASSASPPATATSATPVPATSGTATSSSGGAATDNACAAQTEDACYACCSSNHPTGSDATDEVESGCICAPTRCGTQCAKSSYCSDSDNAPDPTPGDACDTCMKKYENDDGTGECDQAVAAAAEQAGGDQAAFVACENNCP